MPRILWVADRLDWAWGHMGRGFSKYVPSGYTVEVIDQSAYGVFTKENPQALLDYDAVLDCSWPEASTKASRWMNSNGKRCCTLVASHGLEYPFPQRDWTPQTRIATRLRNRDTAKERLPHFNAVLCVNEQLHQLAGWINDNSFLTIPGVDTEVFSPSQVRVGEKLRVGWCGQRTGATKGYEERLVPLMERMGSHVEFIVNDRAAGDALTQAEMVEWYSQIDVLLSTSYSEGCQMPVLEAMACSRPVVATNCGCAHLLVQDNHTGFLIDSGDGAHVIPMLADALYRLSANEVLRVQMGGNARWLVDTHYSWRVRAKEWLAAICGSAA